jgi:mono/diheme cytochrome c family protein
MNRHLARALVLFLPALIVAATAPPWEKPRREGRDLFLENCSVCHELVQPKSPKIGPSLVRFKKLPPERARAFRTYIMTFIRSGAPKMPAFAGVLTEEQIRRVADYLLPEQ